MERVDASVIGYERDVVERKPVGKAGRRCGERKRDDPEIQGYALSVGSRGD